MTSTLKLKEGFDINLAGKAEKKIADIGQPKTFALNPKDFLGITRPKVLVKEGDTVKAGTPIMFDKLMDQVLYVSPVSGEIAAINRGEKRALIDIVILADSQMQHEEYKRHTVSEIGNLSREVAKETMLKSGVWPNLVQRPFGLVANPDDSPKAIFISTFDTHPLAPDYGLLFKDAGKYFEAGVTILGKLTKGSVHIGLNGAGEASNIFSNAKQVKYHTFSGPHPAGNVGVHIHHVAPISKGEIVWTINPFGVIQIGKLFLDGMYDGSKIIAVAGPVVSKPQYYKTYLGAHLGKFLENNLTSDHVRVVSGNALTGQSVGKNGYLGYYDNLVTVLEEGDRPRFFLTEGWLAPVANRLSFHRAFGLLSFLSPKKEFALDTSTNGEDRAFVMTGAFEQVMPMDIFPLYLFKAIMANDYEEMEELGIYELLEEDVALCEFIDVSKHDLQQLLRKGLNMLMEG